MRKKLKLLLILLISVILFYKIVVNADSIKHNLSWIFEGNEEEMALPELSNEEIEKAKANLRNDEKPRARKSPSEISNEVPNEAPNEATEVQNASPEQEQSQEEIIVIEENPELKEVMQAPVEEGTEQKLPVEQELQPATEPTKPVKKKRKLIKKISKEPAVMPETVQ